MTKPSMLYVVMGSTGEYSSRDEWPVWAYLSEAEAQAHVLNADAWLREHRLHMDDDRHATYAERVAAGRNPFDPSMLVDYTGTRYWVMDVPFGAFGQAHVIPTPRATAPTD